jgi:uncharacterized RDD family membrane protein YckC
MPSSESAAPRRAATPAALGWRLLAATYDALPLLPISLLVSFLALAINGMQPVASPLGRAAMALALWTAAGLYFTVSWRRGGQTMGMRPWRLQVLRADGGRPELAALWKRYAVATLSLAAGGLGFLWSLVDGERRAWHDLASGTVLVRLDAAPPR